MWPPCYRYHLVDRNCTSSSLQVILCGYAFSNRDDGWCLVFGLIVYNFLIHELSDLPCITGKQGYIDVCVGWHLFVETATRNGFVAQRE